MLLVAGLFPTGRQEFRTSEQTSETRKITVPRSVDWNGIALRRNTAPSPCPPCCSGRDMLGRTSAARAARAELNAHRLTTWSQGAAPLGGSVSQTAGAAGTMVKESMLNPDDMKHSHIVFGPSARPPVPPPDLGGKRNKNMVAGGRL